MSEEIRAWVGDIFSRNKPSNRYPLTEEIYVSLAIADDPDVGLPLVSGPMWELARIEEGEAGRLYACPAEDGVMIQFLADRPVKYETCRVISFEELVDEMDKIIINDALIVGVDEVESENTAMERTA